MSRPGDYFFWVLTFFEALYLFIIVLDVVILANIGSNLHNIVQMGSFKRARVAFS